MPRAQPILRLRPLHWQLSKTIRGGLLVQSQFASSLSAQAGAAGLEPFLQTRALWAAAGGVVIDARAPIPITLRLGRPQRAIESNQAMPAIVASQGQARIATGAYQA